MEKYIQDIELINRFINNELNAETEANFQNRIKAESEFNNIYEEHLSFLEGLKRIEIKQELNKIHENYIKLKWFKYMTISLLILAVIIVSYVLLIGEDETIVKEDLQKEFNTEQVVITQDTTSVEVKEVDTVTKVSSIKKVISTSPNILLDTTNQIEYNIKNALKKKAQDFTINVERDTMLIGNEGTRLTIRANSFITKDSILVNGKINIKLTEYYKLSDILFEDLTTTSDGKLIETGGMLFIEARQEDKLLELKNKSEIEIEFPYEQGKEDMQLFLGEERENFVNWQLRNREREVVPIIAENIDVEIIRPRASGSFVAIQNGPTYPGCENRLSEKARKCTADKIREFVASNINTTLIEDLSLPRQRINAIFKIDKTGVVKNGYTSSQEPRLEAEIIRVLKKLPKMTPVKQRRRAVEVEYILPLILGEEDNVRDNRLPFVRDSISSLTGTVIANNILRDTVWTSRSEVVVSGYNTGAPKLSSVVVNESEKVKRYTLRAPKLGWINCDRFVRSNKKKIKYKLKIKDAKGVDIKLIFKDISSVLPYKHYGEFYDFGTVPKGDTIKLVAIKTIEGKLYVDIIDTITEVNPIIEFNFEEVTIEQLQKRIQELDDEF